MTVPHDVQSAGPAWKSRTAWVMLLGVVCIGLVVDLGSKTVAFRTIGPTPAMTDAVDGALLRFRFAEAWREAAAIRSRVHAMQGRSLAPLVPPDSTVTVVPHGLDFSLVLNPGAVFGIGAGRRVAFMIFTLAALAFAAWMFGWWTTGRDRVAHAAIGLLIAGGLGNLFDRLVFGCVRDFLHPLPGVTLPFGWTMPHGDREIWPYVSNIADLWLILGIGTLMVCMFRQGRRERAAATRAATDQPA